jgi:hypothetical protein
VILTYTGAQNLYGLLTGSQTTNNLALGAQNINVGYKFMLGTTEWPFLERTVQTTTIAGQQFYNIPNNVDKLITATITVGSVTSGGTIFRTYQATSRDIWDTINTATGVTSTDVSYCYILNGQIGFWPIPSASSNTITINYKIAVRDLAIADLTTATVVTATQGSPTLTMATTAMTAGMAGAYIQIAPSFAAGKGDGLWYQILSFVDTTHLTLVNNYVGASIATGTASCIIGDVMVTPEKYQIGPVWWAVSEYFLKNGDTSKAEGYRAQFDELTQQMLDDCGKKTASVVLDDGYDGTWVNPNLAPMQIL